MGEKDREIYKPTKLYRIFQNAQKAAWKHRKDTSLQHRWNSSLTQDKRSLTWYATASKKMFIHSMKKNDDSMHASQEEWQFNRAPCKKNRLIHEDAPYAEKKLLIHAKKYDSMCSSWKKRLLIHKKKTSSGWSFHRKSAAVNNL